MNEAEPILGGAGCENTTPQIHTKGLKMTPEQQHRAAVAALENAQITLRGTPKVPPEARAAAVAAVEAAMAPVRELKEAIKRENTRRNFAGLTSALFTACSERFDGETIALLSARALEIHDKRVRAAAERRTAKGAAASPTLSMEPMEAPRPPPPEARKRASVPEIFVRRPGANGSAR